MSANQTVEYRDGDTLLEAYCVRPDHKQSVLGAVLVVHDWSGRNAFANHKAEQLAELGYIGFAIDMYGKGKTGKTKEEKTALIQPFMQDRRKLQQRIAAALEALKTLEGVDANRIGAIGFCFGGLCALDLARSGADIKAVVSFHGLLNAPEQMEKKPIKAKILALHGFDDPMGPPEQVIAFCKEMTEAKANWQLDMYGNTVHAFTNPEANDPGFGTVYHRQADSRSWVAMQAFFRETLS